MDKLAELIGSLKDYFNDFVGAIVPGTVLAAGVLWLGADFLPTNAFSLTWGEWSWLPGVAVIFLLGHALLSLHDLVARGLQLLRQRLASGAKTPRQSPEQSSAATDVEAAKGSLSIMDKAQSNLAYKAFCEVIGPKLTALGVSTKLDFHGARNIAMSLSTNGADLGRRFMFISLFCYGTSAAAWMVAVLDVLFLLLGFHKDWVLKEVLAAALVCAALLLRRRGSSFELRAFTVPFSVATAGFLVPALDEHLKH